MSRTTTNLTAWELLEWLRACDSRDYMRAAIQSWLQASPAPPSMEQIMARVDEALAGWYQPPGYDPSVVAPAIAELVEVADRIVRESGTPGASEQFDARAWVDHWVHVPHPALGGQCPIDPHR